ncbi:SLC13 family permease [Domibacillus iocasae]|uniref:Citrate:succinate antiporter n=1 Tax=Domibacillus iocasae TaxID=1714016 RepID=A0A1E7DTT7_9BACI|nr:SLC13 family permease [Domibacillus iocasae]OES46425.1 citrate:succinate antiporter [Domibacillus iocasae]
MIQRSALRAKRKPSLMEQLDRYSTRMLSITALHVFYALMIVYIDPLTYSGKIVLFSFLSAMTLWIATKIPAGLVAVGVLAFAILMRASEPELLYSSLSEEVVWLMVGSFIIGEAVKQSGLAERFSRMILTSGHSVLGRLASLLVLSAFFIPSTSGRAALSIPIIKQLRHSISKQENEALAIMAPVIILMSTSATLIGTGSHLIGIGLLEASAGETISFVQWLVWSVPFTVTVTLLSYYVMKWQLWPKRARNDESLIIEETRIEPLKEKEKKTVWLIGLIAMAWMTEELHGYDLGFTTIVGALLFMLPRFGIMTWNQGVKSVSWNLILFVAAAAALGTLLVEAGVVVWLEREIMSILHLFTQMPEWFMVVVILLVTTTSHLYITSHTTRAIVFIPSLILFGQAINANVTSVVFLSLIGMNYCVTFPVSSKALLIFYEEGEVSYEAKDLLKISLYLLPLYIIVMLLFYFTYWSWTGLSI